MAVDVCSEISSLVVSPRISFSHDLKEADVVPVECYHRRSDALLLESIDFNFCIARSFKQELPSADELFANGKILPVEVKKITSMADKEKPSKENLQSRPISACFRKSTIIPAVVAEATSIKSENANEETKRKSLKELLSISTDDEELKPSSKPFWQFRRSSSLNIDSSRSSPLIRSLHFLSRSNSTGSAPNPKPSVLPKVFTKQHSKKEPSIKRTNSSVPSPNHYYSFTAHRSPSLGKNYGSGVRVSPVLNFPHTSISRVTTDQISSDAMHIHSLPSTFSSQGQFSKKKRIFSKRRKIKL